MADRDYRMLRVIVAVLALALAATAGAASPKIHAKLTFKKVGYEYRNVELAIDRNGKHFSHRIGRTFFTRPKLHVRDLDADGESEFWVDTYTGGAHCCDESRFFRYVPARATYAVTRHGWGDTGYRAKNLDGRDGVELVSSDDRFAYVFTDFADSFFPIQLWHFDRGRLVDVTRTFPGQIDVNATALWSSYLNIRRTGDVRGVLAAWLADQYLLDREQAGWKALEAANRRGELDAADDFWPTGDRYLRALRTFLVKTGYA
jgi:hypothetical protein